MDFIFSSPNQARYKEFMKNLACFVFTLPHWSYIELLNIQVSVDDWYEQVYDFGGVPRIVFWDGMSTDPTLSLEKALQRKRGIVSYSFLRVASEIWTMRRLSC
jgi:hypothetical protein